MRRLLRPAVLLLLLWACSGDGGHPADHDSGAPGPDSGDLLDAAGPIADAGDAGDLLDAGADGGGGPDPCLPSAELVERVSTDRLLADLEALSASTRASHAEQTAAAQHIEAALSGLPGVELAEHTYRHGGEEWINVEVTIPGSELPDEVLMLGAHYDSVARGADDNASGTAALMEVVRVMAGCVPRRSVRVLFFSNEEEGTIGSLAYVSSIVDALSPDDLVGYVNVDMIAYGPEGEDLDLAGRAADGDFVLAAEAAAEGWTDLDVRTVIDDHCG